LIEENERELEDEISFSSESQTCCVGFVTMLDSIKITFEIKDPNKIRRYYSIFINTLASIARSFGAKIIKSTDTSIIYYFPKTSSLSSGVRNLYAFKDVILCGITMIAANADINAKLMEEGLPSLHYKISADYGRVEMARSSTSPEMDLFGPTMNACAKINSIAPPNGMVIGSDLYYIVKKFSLLENDYYHFKRIGEYSISASFKHRYPVYLVLTKKNKENILSTNKQDTEHKPIVRIPHGIANPLRKDVRSRIKHNRYQQQQKPGIQDEEQPKYSHNILIIDDEPDILLTYKAFLLNAGQGYNIDVFSNSQKALERFSQVERSYYSLAIMDVRMPDLNGLELYRRLKSINPEIKVLFVSALGVAEEISSVLLEVKPDDVIQKPVDKENFIYKVKEALSDNHEGPRK
jgi:two-component system, OmpR family, response regulator ChvI